MSSPPCLEALCVNVGCLCFSDVLFLGLLEVCAEIRGRSSVLSVTLCLAVIWDCLSVFLS